MKFVNKFETDDEIMVILSIDKQPLKEVRLVDELKVDDLTDTEILDVIKKDINNN